MNRAQSSWLATLADPCGVDANGLFGRRFELEPLSFLQLADAHGLLPIVARNLKHLSIEVDDASPGCDEGLQRALAWAEAQLRARLVQSMVIRKQGDELDRELQAADIPGMFLKGADFADHLYPSPSMRFFTDLDLLIRKSDLHLARAVLSDLGYRPADESWQKHRSLFYGEEGWKREDKSVAYGEVELHWNAVNSPILQKSVSIELEDLLDWDSLGKGGLGTPDFSARLLIASAHAATSHCFDRLILLCDIRQIVRRGAGSWDIDTLLKRIDETGTKRPVQMALFLCRRIWNDSECDAAFDELKMRPPGFLLRALMDRSVVLGAPSPLTTLRKKGFRQYLKRAA